METILSVKKIKKSYDGKVDAVKGIDFDVEKGEIFALIGPNGAGKSTTLKMVSTILSPTSGEVFIHGEKLSENPEKIREYISYLPEEAGAYKNLSGYDYLQLMAALFSDDKTKQKQFLKKAEEICGLGKRLKDKIKTYSKGMTRKILLARTIMVDPVLAILDEPTSGLDVINALEIRKTIKKLTEKGTSVLLSSHNMLEIEFLSDRVAIIDQGKIYEIGKPEDLKKKYKAKNLEEVFVQVSKNSKSETSQA